MHTFDGVTLRCLRAKKLMSVLLRHDVNGVDWAELASVFERAPLGIREPEKLCRAFANSYRICFAYDGQALIGAARMISDGEYCASIYDVVVLPEFQGQGIGTQMITALLVNLDVGSIILVSVPGMEEFYRKNGFERLKTGMARYRNPKWARDAGYIE